MKERLFRFKQFSVKHQLSAMKVGVDAVLLGAWADIADVRSVLDVGTGCGVIALAVAQRASDARILAIDIDTPSVVEASENFANSPWSQRLEAQNVSFDLLLADTTEQFDLVISNPPFFDSGVDPHSDSRMRARHVGELSPFSILGGAGKLLSPQGRVAMIVSADMEDRLCEFADASGLCLLRGLRVKGTPAAPPKRFLAEFIRKCCSGGENRIETLTIQTAPEAYTEEYIALTKGYYIKF